MNGPGADTVERAASRARQAPAVPPSRRVAIVVPLANQPVRTDEERQAIRHILHYLPDYDRYMVAPHSLDYEHPEFRMLRVSDGYFGSLNAHSRMMLSPEFYRLFLDYEYILFHHLDALVLSPDLEAWCDMGYDFIGAPRLVAGGESPTVVGNGGFALRRVRAFLDVLESDRYAVDPEEYWRQLSAGLSLAARLIRLPLRYIKRLKAFNNLRRQVALEFSRGPVFEDIFITENARKFAPGFRFAPLDEALRFAFDETPRQCFEMNGRQLPFGCHAWFKQDREFWEPYLLRD